MSSTPSINTVALQEILLGLAEGLNDAQQKLRTMAPYDEYGRPNTLYQVPYMDFTLQVTTEFQTVTSGGSSASTAKVMFSPAPKTAGTTTTTSNTEIFSSISGRFVAVLPNDGLPQTIIQVVSKTPAPSSGFLDIVLEVYLSNVAGEKMVNSLVEFNYDADGSAPFNTAMTPPYTLPTFTASEAFTDVNGLCTTTVRVLESEYNAGRFYLLTVNTGPVVKTISINKL